MAKSSIGLFFYHWSFIFLSMYSFGGAKGDSDESESSKLMDSHGGLSSRGKIILYAVAIVTFLLLGFWFLCCNLRSKRNIRELTVLSPTRQMRFESKGLWQATGGYHENSKIGSTQWASVYKGVLQDGLVVAIKRLNLKNSDEANRSFLEVSNGLIELRHRNLVRMLGFAADSEYKEVVMEYVDCQTLDHYLHLQGNCSLSWETRIKIAQGTARALVYLHQTCTVNKKGSIVHGNLKPSNIFVNREDQEALLSDYGIASLIKKFSDSSSAFRGLYGYAAPECKRSETVTTKADVYSYGMVLLELLTVKRPTSDEVGGDLAGWVRSKLPDRYGEILDPALFVTATANKQKKMVRVLGLALICTRDEAGRRPSMKEVVEMLNQINNSGRSQSKAVVAPVSEMEEEV